MPTPHSQPDRHTGRRAVMLAVAALVLLGRRRAADPAFFAPAPALPQEPTPGLVPVRTRAQRSRARRLLTVVSAGAVAAAVALFLGASSAPATVDWQSGFEQTLSPWQDLQYQTDKPQADSFNFVTSPVRTGSYAAQFVARQGYGPYGGERTELCCGPSGEGAPGSEHWWAWSTYFSPDWSEPYKWGMFFQLHAGDDMPPAIAFDAGADAVWVDIRAGQVDPTNVTWSYGNFPQILSTLSKGQWNDFVLHVRWSLTDGQVEVWHRLGGNGGFSEVLNVDHIPTLQQYANGSVPGIYTKLGIYRDSYCSNPAPGCTSSLGVQPADTLYDDNFVRGSSFDDVVNAAWGSGSAPATAPSAPASAPPPTTTTTVEPPPATTTTADTTTTDTTTTTTTTTTATTETAPTTTTAATTDATPAAPATTSAQTTTAEAPAAPPPATTTAKSAPPSSTAAGGAKGPAIAKSATASAGGARVNGAKTSLASRRAAAARKAKARAAKVTLARKQARAYATTAKTAVENAQLYTRRAKALRAKARRYYHAAAHERALIRALTQPKTTDRRGASKLTPS